MTQLQTDRAKAAAQSLLNAGAPKDKLSWLIGQLSFETANFSSQEAEQDNNLSGITFANQSLATQGQKMPMAESKTGYYAHYNNYDEWAKDYLRILNTVGTARPLNEDTVEGFVSALKKNGYFTSPNVAAYTNGVKENSSFYQKLLNLDSFVKAAVEETVKGVEETGSSILSKVKRNPIPTAIITSLVLISIYAILKSLNKK